MDLVNNIYKHNYIEQKPFNFFEQKPCNGFMFKATRSGNMEYIARADINKQRANFTVFISKHAKNPKLKAIN